MRLAGDNSTPKHPQYCRNSVPQPGPILCEWGVQSRLFLFTIFLRPFSRTTIIVKYLFHR